MKAISLDIWNTLIKSNPEFKQNQLSLFFDFLQPTDTSLEELAHIKERIDKRTDQLSVKTGLDYSFGHRVNKIAKLLGIPPLSDALLIELYQQLEDVFLSKPPLLIEDNLLEILQKLKERHLKIILLSNTGFIKGATMRKLLAKLEILELVDLAVFSDEVGFSKPSRKIFAHVMQKFDYKPDEYLHIGDHLVADYKGAKKTGWNSVLFVKDIKFVQDITKINSLEETLEIL